MILHTQQDRMQIRQDRSCTFDEIGRNRINIAFSADLVELVEYTGRSDCDKRRIQQLSAV